MSFLSRLLGIKTTPPDPTLDWPPYQDTQRIVVPYEGRFGGLKFGDSIDLAKSFGKPSIIRWIENNYCLLIYSHAGFQLEFEDGFLVYFALFTNRPIDDEKFVNNFNSAEIHLQLADGNTADLCKESKRSDIEAIFGNPNNIDFDDDETILYYTNHNLTMEFELQPNDGVLMRMNLFPT